MAIKNPLTALALALAAGCGGEALETTPTVDPSGLRTRFEIDARRSLLITDRAVLDAKSETGRSRFSLRRVLDHLAHDNGNGALDAQMLFRQMWDTQNPAPGYTGRGPHCDDRGPMINGLPLTCRPNDGLQAKGNTDELLDGYFPIALVNRFDLASPDGRSCGEYRIVYSKGPQLGGRSLIIFEAALESPRPELGLAACEPIQKLWAGLSDETMSPESRAEILDGFYFEGAAGFPPVIRVDAFNLAATGPGSDGQIRTNQFIDRPWSLRELKLSQTCDANGTCDLLFVPVSVKANPFGRLFASDDANALAFQAEFADNVQALGANDVSKIGYANATDTYNASESTDDLNLDYSTWFNKERSGFRDRIQARLTEAGSTLTPEQVINRARTQSCMGCHQRTNNLDLGNGLRWPRSLGFVHVSETIEQGPEGERYKISPALTDHFLPARKDLVETFLGYGPLAVEARAARLERGPTHNLRTIGGQHH